MRTTQAGFKSGRGGEGPADLLERLGPTVLVDVGLKSRAAAGEPPDLPLKRVRALIDTGATGECIDEDLAQSLDLPISEQGWMSGVGGRHRTVIYTARIYVPSLERLLFQRFTGVKLAEGDQWHRVILGRRFLRLYRLNYDGGTGAVEIAER
jgi:predicted aspartyl protease